MEYIIGYEEMKEEDTDEFVESKSNDVLIDTGVHYYGETVSQIIPASNMLDFIGDIFIQYKQGRFT